LVWFLHVATLLSLARNFPEAITPQGNESRYPSTDFYDLAGIPGETLANSLEVSAFGSSAVSMGLRAHES
jgi:hypothetical protein